MYVARFERIGNDLFRFDTRIYLDGFSPNAGGACVGAIVGKNPGSASPTELSCLAPLKLNGDKMLPYVRARFIEAFREAGEPVPTHAFVRVWNLLYICNPDLRQTLQVAQARGDMPICDSEQQAAPLVWYGWGGPNGYLDKFKVRFMKRHDPHQFFYDHRTHQVVTKAPAVSDFAKHTQGMPSGPVVTFLSHIVSAAAI